MQGCDDKEKKFIEKAGNKFTSEALIKAEIARSAVGGIIYSVACWACQARHAYRCLCLKMPACCRVALLTSSSHSCLRLLRLRSLAKTMGGKMKPALLAWINRRTNILNQMATSKKEEL